MIFRATDDGWMAFPQLAHAWLAGELAARWRADAFVSPQIHAAVVTATRLHDIGWQEIDASPEAKADGTPCNFLELTTAQTLPIWRHGLQRVTQVDPYAGLLVAMHAETVYRARLRRLENQQGDGATVAAEVAFLRAWRDDQRQRLQGHPHYADFLTPTQLDAAYLVVRMCDLICLALLTGSYPPEGRLTAAPIEGAASPLTLAYQMPAPFTLALEPHPLTVASLTATVNWRAVPVGGAATTTKLRAELDQAPWLAQTVSLIHVDEV